MKNNETILTNELYKSIIDSLTTEVTNLKQAQNDTIYNLSIKTETLKSLKEQLIEIKKTIKETRKEISKDKSNLRGINNQLNETNHQIIDLNYNFITEGDSYIDPETFPSLESNPKKR